MEFALRYDLERSLIKKTVESFAATDRETKEPVMVHVFPAAEHGLDQSSLPEEVLRKFHELTRAQVRIRAVGVDAATKNAYVVTPEIDPDYISVWGMEPSTGLGPFSTAIFSDQLGEAGAPATPADEPPPSRPQEPAVLQPYVQGLETPALGEPGAFTKEFLSLQSKTGGPAATSQPALTKPFAAQQPGVSTVSSHGEGEPSLAEVLRRVDAASGHPELSSPLPSDERRKAVPEVAPLPAAPATPAAGGGPSFTALFAGPPAASTPTPAAPPRSVEPAPKPQGGSFTAMFGAAEAKSHVEPKSAVAPATPAVPPAAKPPAGSFTQMFGAAEAKSHLDPKSAAPPPPAGVPPAAKGQAGSFTQMFGASEAKSNLEPRPAAPPAPPAAMATPKPQAGAFTQMFGAEEAKAHFERPSIPAQSSPPPIPPAPIAPAAKPQAGAFTQMFGASETKAHLEPKAAAPPMAPTAAPKPQAGAFTRMFGPQDTAGVAATPAAANPTPTPAMPAAPPAPSFQPVVGASAAANGSGSPATRFFKGMDAAAAGPKAPAIPSGPSEYTKIVKFSEVMQQASAQPGAGVPPANPNVPGASFRPPVMPGYPQMPGIPPMPAAPPMPGMPAYQPPQAAMPQYAPPQMPYAMPQMQAPPMPQYQVPQPPPMAAPQMPVVAKPKSWIPLVILFLGLTVVALLVVLLFALKGH